ncbi:ABC transporter permease, partial [Burkholderia sp. SIMBA_019]
MSILSHGAVPNGLPHSPSPRQRAWQRFRRNRLGYWSLILFVVIFVLSLCAEVLSSDRPLV